MTTKTLQEILADIANAIEKSEGKYIAEYKSEDYTKFTGEEEPEILIDASDAEDILKEMTRSYEPEGASEDLKEVLELLYYNTGGEGSGENEPQIVWKYKPTDQLVGFQGWYASHHGTDWDEGFQEWEVRMVPEYARKR